MIHQKPLGKAASVNMFMMGYKTNLKMDCLVLGATGLIGRHIVNKLLSRRRSVRILATKSSNTSIFKDKDIELVYGDLLDVDSLISAMKGVDVVFHSAAYVSDWGPKSLFLKINVDGTRNVLEACLHNNIKRLIYLSTYDVFDFKSERLISEKSKKVLKPYPYSYSKLLAERLVWQYGEKYGIPVTVVYPPWVYGPGDLHLFPGIVKALKTGKFFYFGKNGNNYIELCYVINLVEAIVNLSETDEAIGEGYVVSDGTRVTFRQLLEKIAEIANLEKPKLSFPYLISYGIAFLLETIYKVFHMKNRPMVTRHSVELLGRSPLCDNSKLKQLGFRPRFSFEGGFKNAIADLRLRKIL